MHLLTFRYLLPSSPLSKPASNTAYASEEVPRSFFINFSRIIVEKCYKSLICMPQNEEKIKNMEKDYLYRKCGFPGAIGSTDCVHIAWDR